MYKDIDDILEGWEYNPHELNVRVIKGKDEKEKLQLRLDLGLLQMEMDGRPDGKRPYNKDSFLQYYKFLVEEQIKFTGSDKAFKLDVDDLVKLQQEALQYYHRYLCFFQIEDFEHAVRDTARNLEVVDFVQKYCDNEEDSWNFVQHWPYIKMMNTRAQASIALEHKRFDEAIVFIKDGIEMIKNFFKQYEMSHDRKNSREVEFLEDWAKSVTKSKPQSPRQKLEKKLQQAISKEEYEKAAKIRDKLKSL